MMCRRLPKINRQCICLRRMQPAAQVDDRHVVVECKTGKVECTDLALQGRVEVAVKRLIEALTPASFVA